MKFKVSLPVIIGLVVVLGAGLILLRGRNAPSSTSQPNQPQSLSPAGDQADTQVDEQLQNLEPTGEVVDGVREITMTAKQWEFSPNPVVVKFGDKVRIRITSTDVPHGFALPDFGINEVLNPGQEVVVEFEANKRGSFEFFCSVQCGLGHSGMRGNLIVQD